MDRISLPQRAARFLLPKHMLRAVYLISLYINLDIYRRANRSICDLNDRLALVTDLKALEFPIRLKLVVCEPDAIWSSLNLIDDITNASKTTPVIAEILDSMPSWLIYDDSSVMVDDIREVLRLAKNAARQ